MTRWLTLILNVSLLFLTLTCATSSYFLPVDEQNGHYVKSCSAEKPTKFLVVVEQWSLHPSLDSRTDDFEGLYLRRNQTEVFNQVSQWIEHGQSRFIFAENCVGEINEHFKESFNGWNYQSLQVASTHPDFDAVLTHIPLKLKAKFGSKVEVRCAEDERLLKQHAAYVDEIKNVFGALKKLSPNQTPSPQTLARIEALKSLIIESFDLRAKAIANYLTSHAPGNSTVILSGALAEPVVRELSTHSVGCNMFEPKSYMEVPGNAAKLLEGIVQSVLARYRK